MTHVYGYVKPLIFPPAADIVVWPKLDCIGFITGNVIRAFCM